MTKAKEQPSENYEEKLSVKGSFDDIIKASVFANRKGQIKKAAVKKAVKKDK